MVSKSNPDSISLRVENLSVTYPNGHRAISEVSFSLSSGSTCALVGVNGSGKSTLFNAVMGIVRPTTGSVTINDMPIAQALKNNSIAYVPQSENIDWHFPILVKDVVMLGRYGHMGMLRRPKKSDHQAVNEALERMGIADLAKRQIGALSGGQKKRVFLARALAQESRVILLDEPFTGVDVKTEYSIMELLKFLCREGYLMLVSTHNLGAVPQYCNEVVLLNRTIIAHGSVEEIYTVDNLEKTFGGVLKNVRLGDAQIVSDDEHPAVFYNKADENTGSGRANSDPNAETQGSGRANSNPNAETQGSGRANSNPNAETQGSGRANSNPDAETQGSGRAEKDEDKPS